MVVVEGLWAAALGGAQWLVLTQNGIAFATRWALVTVFTTWLGLSVTEVLSEIDPNGFTVGLIAVIAVAGIVCGAIQTRWLRRRAVHAGWWVAALTGAWILLLAGAVAGAAAAAMVIPGSFDDTIHLTIGYFVGGIAFGALTGGVLEQLLRAPTPPRFELMDKG